MATYGNAGNPFDLFDPLAAQQQQQQQQQPSQVSPFGGVPPTPQPQAYQQPQYQQPFTPAPAPSMGYPPQQQPQPDLQQQNQLVVSAQQSNPYATAFLGTQPYGGAPPPASAATATSSAAPGTSFDPFAAPAPAPPAPMPPATPQYQPQPVAASPYQATYQDPFGSQNYAAPAAPPPAAAPQPALAAPSMYSEYPGTESQIVPAQPPPQHHHQQQQYHQQQQQQYQYEQPEPSYDNPPPSTVETRNTGYGGDGGEEDELQKNQYLNNYNDRQMVSSPTTSTTVTVRSPEEVRNKYSQALAQQAGPMASPLPKAELVRKKGYVLSRISFRTIVMKKWKQSFWIQYGSHTMLWFRNESDFDDWLNNPYHTQSQRNFLIKLAVNFVHDLYKPNVRGYQVTQCRTKPYGNKVVRQFKLERWMDYGPTIAAAFGSYDPKEVDACREAIVECMKNTPLDNGIRATGAVKEYHERQQAALEEQRMRQEQQRQNGGDGGRYQNYQLPDGYRNANGGRDSQSLDGYGQRSGHPRPASQSVASATDLLGDHGGFDDSASVPPTSTAAVGDLLGGELVPATNPNPSYPGAPPPNTNAYYTQQPQYQQQFYDGSYAAAGAPPTPQQQPNYMMAQPPAYPQHQEQQQQQQMPQAAAFGGYEQQQPQAAAYGGYEQQQPQAAAYGFEQQQPQAAAYGGYEHQQYSQQQYQQTYQQPQQGGYAQPPQQDQGGYPMGAYLQPTQY